MDSWPGFFIEKSQRKESKMGLAGLAILGVLLGAAGMEVLRTKKPQLVAKAESDIRRIIDSARSRLSARRKAKDK